jgi:hypothetical protein
MLANLIAFIKNLFKPKALPAPAPICKEEEPVGRELPSPEEKRKVKLGLIVGHSKKNVGARMCAPYNHSEYAYNMVVAEKAKAFAALNHEPVIVEVIYRDGIGIAGAYAKAMELKCDAVIELHFNEYNKEVRGTETLCSHDVSDVDFAYVVHKIICNVFRNGDFSRGVQTLGQSMRGGENVWSFPNGVNCLVEPFFGDNPEDAKDGMALQDTYAKALIQSVALWAKKTDLV